MDYGGNTDIEDVEISFIEYVLDRRDYNIGVLERSYNLKIKTVKIRIKMSIYK